MMDTGAIIFGCCCVLFWIIVYWLGRKHDEKRFEDKCGVLVGRYSPVHEDLKNVPGWVKEHIKHVQDEEEESSYHLEGLDDTVSYQVNNEKSCYNLVFCQHRTYGWVYRR